MFNLELVNKELLVDTLQVAKEFDRPHNKVLESIRSVVKKTDSNDLSILAESELRHGSYFDKNNQKRPLFLLNEEAALICMPFIGGRKSLEGQAMLVRSFLSMKKELLLIEQGRQEERFKYQLREQTKIGCYTLEKAIHEYYLELEDTVPNHMQIGYIYNRINIAVLGMDSFDYRLEHKTHSVRDHLKENNKMFELELINQLQKDLISLFKLRMPLDNITKAINSFVDREKAKIKYGLVK